MSYTTGEIAKLCGVTVRTVQYYDGEGLLKPDGLSEGGRRLYGEESLKTLQVICIYKSLGFSLADIKRVISEGEGGRETLLAVLKERERELGDELDALVSQRESIKVFKERLQSGLAVSPDTLFDVRKIMEGKRKYKTALVVMGIISALCVIAAISFIVIGAAMGIWLPFAIGVPVTVALLFVMVCVYCKNVAYICRDCGKKFVPPFREMFFAPHTPKTRKLTCPHCGLKKYHLETYRDE